MVFNSALKGLISHFLFFFAFKFRTFVRIVHGDKHEVHNKHKKIYFVGDPESKKSLTKTAKIYAYGRAV